MTAGPGAPVRGLRIPRTVRQTPWSRRPTQSKSQKTSE
jgi:hypothetical protein